MNSPNAFVREMWPVLRLMDWLGWVPIQIDPDDESRLTLRTGTSELIFSKFFCTVQVAIFIPHLILFAENLFNPSGGSITINAVKLLACLMAFDYPILYHSHKKSIVDFCNSLHTYQKKMNAALGKSVKLKFGLSSVSRVVVVSEVAPFVLILVLKPILVGAPEDFTWNVLVSVCFASQSLSLAWRLCIFKSLASLALTILQEYQLSSKDHYCGNAAQEDFMVYKELWLNLHKAIVNTGRSNPLATMQPLLSGTVVIVYCIYEFSSDRLRYDAAVFIAYLFVFGLLMIFAVCEGAHYASQKINYAVTRSITISHQSENLDMIRFLVHIKKTPPIVMLSGYIRVDRKYYSQIFVGLVEVWVVLLQLQIDTMPVRLQDML